jgi:hypothetical protein
MLAEPNTVLASDDIPDYVSVRRRRLCPCVIGNGHSE